MQSTQKHTDYSPAILYDAYIYFKSKLANVLFTKALTKRLTGTNVTVNSLHPGAVMTELQHHTISVTVSINYSYIATSYIYLNYYSYTLSYIAI